MEMQKPHFCGVQLCSTIWVFDQLQEKNYSFFDSQVSTCNYSNQRLCSRGMVAGADIQVWMDISEGSSEHSFWLPLRHPQPAKDQGRAVAPQFWDFSHGPRLWTQIGGQTKGQLLLQLFIWGFCCPWAFVVPSDEICHPSRHTKSPPNIQISLRA